jgi:flagella basal body P-ring formation protein FlgA
MTRTYIRAITLSLTLLFGTASLAAQPQLNTSPTGPVTLQDSVRLDGKIVYLGDLFINTGTKAQIAVAYSPAPGKRTVFDARWLYRIARANKLKWRPLSRFDRIVVERTSTVISRQQIAEEILVALIDQGADPDMEVEFSNRMLRMHVPGDALAEVGIEDSALDLRSNRFSAIIHAPAGDPGAKRIRVTGRLHSTLDIPVPARRILGGEVIKKDDIKWIKVRSKRLRNNIILSDLDLVGKAARRGLQTGQPVQKRSVKRPVLIQKGKLVTIMLNAPKMKLTVQGKALEDGSAGDVIQVTNSQSDMTIEAEVIGPGRVAVRSTPQLAMNQ